MSYWFIAVEACTFALVLSLLWHMRELHKDKARLLAEKLELIQKVDKLETALSPRLTAIRAPQKIQVKQEPKPFRPFRLGLSFAQRRSKWEAEHSKKAQTDASLREQIKKAQEGRL